MVAPDTLSRLPAATQVTWRPSSCTESTFTGVQMSHASLVKDYSGMDAHCVVPKARLRMHV